MHTVHHTDAFILKHQPLGEANARVWLFTRELGLVVATVQGVRKQGAKLQMQLSDYALVSADLVRGKDVWRLVSATEISNPFLGKRRNGLGRAYVRTLGAVERFCHGEEANAVLFEHLLACLEGIDHKELDERSFDTLSVWKVMAMLGYIDIEEADKRFFTDPFVDGVRVMDGASCARLIRETNDTIKETHL